MTQIMCDRQSKCIDSKKVIRGTTTKCSKRGKSGTSTKEMVGLKNSSQLSVIPWLSSEAVKLACSFYDCGKDVVQFISNSAFPYPSESQKSSKFPCNIPKSGIQEAGSHLSSEESVTITEEQKLSRNEKYVNVDLDESMSVTHVYRKSPKHQRKSRHLDASNHHSTSSLKWINDLIEEIDATCIEPRNIEVFSAFPDTQAPNQPSCDCSCSTVSFEEIVSPTYQSFVSEKVILSHSADCDSTESEAKGGESVCACKKPKFVGSSQHVDVARLNKTVKKNSVVEEDVCEYRKQSIKLGKSSSKNLGKSGSIAKLNSSPLAADSNIMKLQSSSEVSNRQEHHSESDIEHSTETKRKVQKGNKYAISSISKKKTSTKNHTPVECFLKEENYENVIDNTLSPVNTTAVDMEQSGLPYECQSESPHGTREVESAVERPHKSRLDNFEDLCVSNRENMSFNSNIKESNTGTSGGALIASGSGYSNVANSDYPPKLILLSTHSVKGSKQIIDITGSSILTNDLELTESFVKNTPQIAQKELTHHNDAKMLKNFLISELHETTSKESMKFPDLIEPSSEQSNCGPIYNQVGKLSSELIGPSEPFMAGAASVLPNSEPVTSHVLSSPSIGCNADAELLLDVSDKENKFKSDFARVKKLKRNSSNSFVQNPLLPSKSNEKEDNFNSESCVPHEQMGHNEIRSCEAECSSIKEQYQGLNIVSPVESKVLADWAALPSDVTNDLSRSTKRPSLEATPGSHPESKVLVDWNVAGSYDEVSVCSPRKSIDSSNAGNGETYKKNLKADAGAMDCFQSQSKDGNVNALLEKINEERSQHPMIVLWTPIKSDKDSPNRSMGRLNPDDLALIRESFQSTKRARIVEVEQTEVTDNSPKQFSPLQIPSDGSKETDGPLGLTFHGCSSENVDEKCLSNPVFNDKSGINSLPQTKTGLVVDPLGEDLPKNTSFERVQCAASSGNENKTTDSRCFSPSHYSTPRTELTNLIQKQPEEEPIVYASSDFSATELLVPNLAPLGNTASVIDKQVTVGLPNRNTNITSSFSPEKQIVSFASASPLKQEFSVNKLKSSMRSALSPIQEEPEQSSESKLPIGVSGSTIFSKASELSLKTYEAMRDESGNLQKSATPSNQCKRTICSCCKCEQQALPTQCSFERGCDACGWQSLCHHPLNPSTDQKTKRQQPPRENPIDMSSPPFPKSSLEVLSSPFFAHWSYYDIDNDHPLSKYMKRQDTTALDGNDCTIVKNGRVGGYYMPFMSVCAKKKVSSKMICNFYKSRMKKIKTNQRTFSKEKSIDQSPEVSSCDCLENDGDNIWKYYVPPSVVRNSDSSLKDMEENDGAAALVHSNSCKRDSLPGCICVGQGTVGIKAVPLELETSPCHSCDCFISDVGSVMSTHSSVRTSESTVLTEESFTERSQIFNEYLTEMQELCTALNMIVGQMLAVREETLHDMGSSLKKYSALVEPD